jgi:hypothetical protein
MKAFLVFIPLFVILGLAIYFMVSMWTMMPGASMSQHGWLAMFLGIFGSLAVGGGLMFLLFRSSRAGGHDDAADFRTTAHREFDSNEKQQD